jgi:hypothetical protein
MIYKLNVDDLRSKISEVFLKLDLPIEQIEDFEDNCIWDWEFKYGDCV